MLGDVYASGEHRRHRLLDKHGDFDGASLPSFPGRNMGKKLTMTEIAVRNRAPDARGSRLPLRESRYKIYVRHRYNIMSSCVDPPVILDPCGPQVRKADLEV